jgi:hypothetical protein
MAALQQVFPAADETRTPNPHPKEPPTMQACHQMHMLQMAGSGAGAFHGVVCPIPAINAAASAGSWSYTDLTSRKPGSARLTSVSTP